ncbi:PhoU family transcriptional regulator [Thermosipho melanesiensis]|uniref:Phosphate transport regulator n=2 Tax=Thermosipho melanesiensis TaxID=46541 RepID=A6LPA4_THEM4|nr:DUF47 family protein [Thermosipho melanesiensis]ABR31755.1 protein of unknown function DUF47 [Thermosipho melanesiensis BI429]APT74777.1 PhoU family transcriptional regulator [Thermosipho melanesiensis]OOC35095.1 PhoU family transcriptional regulator [Thermosipho melanesiensis]OOC35131.1 PhoU family transcriptional regulator [Thermosipho melanesiensis]OOC36739.1 PhoU family transcriptional regulator [Thermosipho melanesiensis]
MKRFIDRLFPEVSPTKLLSEHAQFCLNAGELVPKVLEDYFSGKDILEYSNQIDEFESSADEIKTKLREVYTKLRWSYFDRIDALEIVHNQDSIIDAVDDFVKIMTMNKVDNCPDEVVKRIKEMGDYIKEVIKYMKVTVDELRNVVESDFSPVEIEREDNLTFDVEKDESFTDKLGIEIGRLLYSYKNTMNGVDIIFLNNIVILMMKIADRAENVVERIRMIIR